MGVNRLLEGWGNPAGTLDKGPSLVELATAPLKQLAPALWHYYAGLSGLGGRFNSLCGRATFPYDARLYAELPELAYLICQECKIKRSEAGPPEAA